MTIKEVVARMQKEKQDSVPSRFPCRAIMVKNIPEYCDLLLELKKIDGIRFVQPEEIFTNADVMPKYENLKDDKYKDNWLILTGVSEYLRLFAKNEMVDRRFAGLWSFQRDATSRGRLIIPLWGCEAQWSDKNLQLRADVRQDDFYFDCSAKDSDEQKMNLLVLSGMFDSYIDKFETFHGNLKLGLQEWFEYWMNPDRNNANFVLLTTRYRSVSTTNGDISVRVIPDILSFIHENMEGSELLTKDNCTEGMQNALFDYALNGTALDQSILKILNVSSFSGRDIMGKWEAMDETYRRLVKVWFIRHPDRTYLCHCFTLSQSIEDIKNILLLEIFKVRAERPEWVDEYRSLVKVMSLKPNDEFFHSLDAIPVYDIRLDFMTCRDRRERIYLLHMVGKWMREDYHQVLGSEKLKELYPELYAYLNSDSLSWDQSLKQYITRYKSYKLENTLPPDEDTYFNEIQTDSYDMRYTILSENIDEDTAILWIDALGIEWAALLQWTLSQNCDADVVQSGIGQANLPTETEFNDQWKVMQVPYVKLDKLDKLAHKGVIDEPDYYSCIEDQLSFVTSVQEKVTELLKEHHRIIITGDHGTSRLAARFFHTRDGFNLPLGSKAYSYGRYCDAPSDARQSLPYTCIANAPDGNRYFVFQNYDHFKQSGYAAGADDENATYGEVHGGATPEEMLVPVIVLDGRRAIPISGNWDKDTVKISKRKAVFTISFNKAVHHLQVKLGGIEGKTLSDESGKIWKVSFPGINQGSYVPQVYADGLIVDLPEVTVKPALGGGDGDLPL